VRIDRARVVVDGKAIDSEPKTDAGRRSVPLDPSLVAILKTHKALQAAEKLAAAGAPTRTAIAWSPTSWGILTTPTPSRSG
jgi:hypothetical protein